MTGGLAVACGLAALHLAGDDRTPRCANGGYDSQLFSLTNQDRTSNGVHSLRFSGTLQNIGEGAPYNCRGVQVSGRSVDMIRRNYFAHPILGCGEYVFSMMQAFGIHYRSAGREHRLGLQALRSPASYINGAFMNSRDHRANILSPNYTEMGVGSDESAPGVTWTGHGQRAERLDVQRGVRPGGLVLATAPSAASRRPKARETELAGARAPPGVAAAGTTAAPTATPAPTADSAA